MRNKKFVEAFAVIIVFAIMMLFFIVIVDPAYQTEPVEENEHTGTGKCLEYATEYKVECGMFVDPNAFCKERPYQVCVRWED